MVSRTTNRSRQSSSDISATRATDELKAIRRTLLAILLLSLVGAGIAGYLVYTHYDTDALVCTVGDCGTVQSSDYATIGPIPIAIPGLGMYLTLALLAVSRLGGLKAASLSTLTIAAWTIILAAVLYAAYLTYVEIWVIDAICQWCVASAIVSVVILALESLILWRVVIDEPGA